MVNKCVEVPACHRVGLPQGRQVEVTYTLYTLYTNIPTYPYTYAPILPNMNWILLIIAGLFEVGFTTCLGKAKETDGTASGLWLTGFVACLILSMVLLYRAVQTIPIGTAYAVWTGIGATGTALLGIMLFREPTDFWRLFFIFTLIASIAGLKVVSN